MRSTPKVSGDDLVSVLSTSSDAEATIVRALLESHGIQAIITSDKLGALAGLKGGNKPTTLVRVNSGDVTEARKIMEGSVEASVERTGVEDFTKLETVIGYQFSDRGLLENALTHRSHAHDDPSSSALDNESLEFLGDAVLGAVVAELLFREFPDRDEGDKSKMKALLVSSVTLAKLGTALQLGDFLLLGKGEERSGGRTKQRLIANAYEAVIAAIFLDGGIESVRAFIGRQFATMISERRRDDRPVILTNDHKSALQEWLQAHSESLPIYTVVTEAGPDHRKVFTVAVQVGNRVVARGEGCSKKEAEHRSAAYALERLKSGSA